MLRWEAQLILMCIGLVFILFLGIIFYESLIPFAISPIHFFGFIIIAIIGYALMSVQIIKGLSPAFVSKALHDTINHREMSMMPWNNPMVENAGQPLMMAMVPLGGIDACKIHPYSSINQSFMILPAKYLGKIGRSFGTKANLIPVDIENVPPEIRNFCTKKYGQRFTKCPKIWMALTSREDESSTPQNEKAVFKFLHDNKQITWLQDRLDEVMKIREKEKNLHTQNLIVEKIGTGRERE